MINNIKKWWLYDIERKFNFEDKSKYDYVLNQKEVLL
tara:strand:+ start:1268 stop:1378 length:111 start_codon:yes stop_codon:yes gene_type:complete